MRQITVRKTELLEALKENLIKHTNERDELLENRRRKIFEKLQAIIDKLADEEYQAPSELSFPDIPDHRKQYERAIKMAEMHVGETFELSSDEFSQFVLDEWSWKLGMLNTSSLYKGW